MNDAIRAYLDDRRQAAVEHLRKRRAAPSYVEELTANLTSKLYNLFGEPRESGQVIARNYVGELAAVVRSEIVQAAVQMSEERGAPPAAAGPDASPTTSSAELADASRISPAQASMRRRLTFRRVFDNELGLTDRIVLSLAHQYAYNNRKRQEEQREPKAITIRRFRKATGCRHATVKRSLQKLQGGGYLDESLSPKEPNPRVRGYVKLAWTESGRGMAYDVFTALLAEIGAGHTAGYLSKASGVSRRTVYRWRQLAMGHENGGNRWQGTSGTDGTRAATGDTVSGDQRHTK